MGYISKTEIKNVANDIIANHGVIRRINIDNVEMPIGFIIRKELENTDTYAKVIFNISFNNHYDNFENFKRFTLNEYRTFAIKHLNSIKNINDSNFMTVLGLDDTDEFAEHIQEENVKKYISCIIPYEYSEDISEHSYKSLVNFIHTNVVSCKNYYKNKRVYIYFI